MKTSTETVLRDLAASKSSVTGKLVALAVELWPNTSARVLDNGKRPTLRTALVLHAGSEEAFKQAVIDAGLESKDSSDVLACYRPLWKRALTQAGFPELPKAERAATAPKSAEVAEIPTLEVEALRTKLQAALIRAEEAEQTVDMLEGQVEELTGKLQAAHKALDEAETKLARFAAIKPHKGTFKGQRLAS